MIVFLNKIREWNRRRLENRRLALRVRGIEAELQNLSQAVVDPNGLSMALLRMRLLRCPEKYEYILCAVPQGGLVIDGGANLGLFSDLMLGLGANVIAFEPNPILYRHLVRKYSNNESCRGVEINQQAISVREDNVKFALSKSGSFIIQSQGGSIEKISDGAEKFEFEIKAINFVDYLKKIKAEGKRPYLIKLDIEGAEFDVLNSILDAGLNDSFDYMVCETHERFFKDGESRVNQLRGRLKSENINNIFLDWA